MRGQRFKLRVDRSAVNDTLHTRSEHCLLGAIKALFDAN